MSTVPDNPDRPCSNCGNRSWNKYLSREPTSYPDHSEVVKHFYSCTGCNSDGFIFAENGVHTYSGKLR